MVHHVRELGSYIIDTMGQLGAWPNHGDTCYPFASDEFASLKVLMQRETATCFWTSIGQVGFRV